MSFIQSNMKSKRSASFTKNRLICKTVKWLLLQCSVFCYKSFPWKKMQKKTLYLDKKYSKKGVFRIVFKICMCINIRKV